MKFESEIVDVSMNNLAEHHQVICFINPKHDRGNLLFIKDYFYDSKVKSDPLVLEYRIPEKKQR